MRHFLLIDDNETFAHLLIRAFSRRDLTLDWVANATAARAYQNPCDGIILDLNLDGESGLLLLPDLLQKHPKSRIVVLTGYASISTAVKAVKMGATQYLPKPADVDTLLAAFADTPISADALAESVPTQRPSLERIKWEHIQYTLNANNGNISATARQLNMHRRTLQRMLAKHPVRK